MCGAKTLSCLSAPKAPAAQRPSEPDGLLAISFHPRRGRQRPGRLDRPAAQAGCKIHAKGKGLALQQLRGALIEPLRDIFGVSDKTLNMTLANVLMSAPKSKRLWLETGTSMIAIDTLVHNFLHRTGILHRLNAAHAYGPACSRPKGCAEIIGRIATGIDARRINPIYPRVFPRLVQHAIWRYCAQMEMDICNGNQIDDRDRCRNARCVLYDRCDRIALQPQAQGRARVHE